MPQPASSPFFPTPLEALLLSTYPLTLIAGSLFSSLSHTTRTTKSAYSPQHQSFQPPHHAPSYFAQKRNVFNLYFVKIGWFWMTVALASFLFTHPHFGAPLKLWRWNRRRIAAVLRWLAATGVWTLVTQWFFGPPLIDRSFRLTGGACENVALKQAGLKERGSLGREILTHAECKMLGGTWSGGIDISGHVFLLILGSAVLWLEVLPTVLKTQGLREARRITMSDGRIVSASVETQGGEKQAAKERSEVTKLGVKVIVAVVGLSWWMLLMTAAFFHTWSEKLSGLIVAFLGVWLVYFLPRGMPRVRAVLGLPGV